MLQGAVEIGLAVAILAGLLVSAIESVVLSVVFASIGLECLGHKASADRLFERTTSSWFVLVSMAVFAVSFAAFMVAVRGVLSFDSIPFHVKLAGSAVGWLLIGVFSVGIALVVGDWCRCKA